MLSKNTSHAQYDSKFPKRKPDFSKTCSYHKMLGINADCLTQNFIEIVGAVFEIWTKKCTKNGVFSPICDPPIFIF